MTTLSSLNVDQFYGIEIGEFPARIAEVALWMMNHIMNNRLSLQFGEVYARIPLRTSPHIHHGDALEIHWSSVLEPERCTYIYGNPPFGGFHYRDEQRQKQMAVISQLGSRGNRIDYVAAWFLKAADYVQKGTAKIAFVATNSITQGEQVAQLWPALFERYKLEIAFAHRTFAWGSDARGRAHVHVVIVGLTRREQEQPDKRLFSYDEYDGEPHESRHSALTAYLFDASVLSDRHLVVRRAIRPLNGLPRLAVGSKPVDDGHYIFTDEEKDAFLAKEPKAEEFMRPFIGGREYINGTRRWILYLEEVAPERLRSLPEVRKRIAAVKKYREEEGGNLARLLASNPTSYHVTVVPRGPFLVLPEVSSENREYLPIGWLEPPTMPSNKLVILQNATKDIFALLVSKMHMAWLAHVGGRLESRFQYSGGIVYNQYSGGIVYNNFPFPRIADKQRKRIEQLADDVLRARSQYPNASLSDLYDPNVMPATLRKAHAALDTGVDRLYRPAPFTSNRERVEYLFGLYERLVTPLAAISPPTGRRTRQSKRVGKIYAMTPAARWSQRPLSN